MTVNVAELIAAIARDLKGKKAIIGISGGKDSSVAAALLALALGNENVIGISMPNGDGSADAPYVDELEKALGIEIKRINIRSIYEAALAQMKDMKILEDTRINLPARIRMSMLFAFSQSIPNSRVINTCNLSEDMMGYSTLFGDMAGSYAPLKPFTVTEIVHEIGAWLVHTIGFPEKLVLRTPSDGLCGSTDEEKMGLRYTDIDQYIRQGQILWDSEYFETADESGKEIPKVLVIARVINKIKARYETNKFKLAIVNIPGPSIPNPGKNFITMEV